MQRIAIIGIGAVGASLALSLRRARPDLKIRGLDRSEVLDAAERSGVVQEKAASISTAVEDADLVVLATPLPTTLRLLERLATHLSPGTLVTDTGRLMGPLCAHAADVLSEDIPFLSGHPFFFSDRGLESAHPSLLQGRPYFLSAPAERSTAIDDELEALQELLRSLGAQPVPISPSTHDTALARAYQLPGLLSAMLARNGTESSSLPRPSLPFPQPIDRNEWRAELLANNNNLLDVLSEAGTSLQKLRNRLFQEDDEALDDLFEAIQQLTLTNPRLPYHLRCPVPDANRLAFLRTIANSLEEAGSTPTEIDLGDADEAIVLRFRDADEVRRAEKVLADYL